MRETSANASSNHGVNVRLFLAGLIAIFEFRVQLCPSTCNPLMVFWTVYEISYSPLSLELVYVLVSKPFSALARQPFDPPFFQRR